MVLASARYHHVTLFKSVVFLDVVQVVATDDNGPLHIHLLENKTTTTPMSMGTFYRWCWDYGTVGRSRNKKKKLRWCALRMKLFVLSLG